MPPGVSRSRAMNFSPRTTGYFCIVQLKGQKSESPDDPDPTNLTARRASSHTVSDLSGLPARFSGIICTNQNYRPPPGRVTPAKVSLPFFVAATNAAQRRSLRPFLSGHLERSRSFCASGRRHKSRRRAKGVRGG